MENEVIEVLDREHGKRVIQYWKDRGVDTSDYAGQANRNDGCTFIYYGVIYDRFSNYDFFDVIKTNTKIITLPDERTIPEYGEMILVWDSSEDFASIEQFSSMGHPNERYPVRTIRSVYGDGKHSVNIWKYWKFPPKKEETPPVVELTIQEISERLNIPVNQLRIKK